MVRYICFIAFIQLFAPFRSLCQELSFDIVKNIETPVNPGTTHTIIFKINNDLPASVVLKVVTVIPNPIKMILCPTEIGIASMTEKNLFLTFSVPKNCKAGTYDVQLFLKNNMGKVVLTFINHIKVKRISEIAASYARSQTYIRAGEKASLIYLVTNNGNAPEKLFFQSRYAAIDGPAFYVLPPDSSLSVVVSSNSLKDILIPMDISLDLKILNEEGIHLKSVQKSITVYPIKTVKNDPFVRLPLIVSASYMSRKLGLNPFLSSYQYQISADGGIDSSGRHRIDFLYRGPDQMNVARIGTFSQKYIGYSNPKISVYAGERTYSSSMLTDMFRFGMGGEVKYTGKKLQLKSYYVKPRFMPGLASVGSFTGEYAINKLNNTNFNLIQKTLSNGKIINVAGTGYGFNNSKNFKSDLNIATSLDKNFSSPAYQGNMEFGAGNFRAAGNALFASKDFGGYFSNTLFLNFNTGYQYKKWRILAGWSFNDANPAQDTVYGVAPYSESISGGIGYKPAKNSAIIIQVIKRTKQDRFENKKFDYEEEFMYVNASQNWKKASMSISTSFGNTKNFLIKDAIGVSRNSDALISFVFKPNQTFSFSIFSHYYKTTRYSSTQQEILLYGAFLSLNIKSIIQFHLQYQNNFLVEELYSDRNLFDAKLSYQINPKTAIGLYANYAILFADGTKRDFYGLATFSRTIGIPVAKVMTYGTFEGQIINKGAQKVEGVIIFLNGNTAITNGEGKFVFNNVSPGKHHLIIDRGSIGFNEIPDVTMPIEIEIFPATIGKIEIGLTKSSKIVGKVGVAKVEKLVRASGNELKLPQVVIEISKDMQTILTTTGPDGYFGYTGLTPGIWKVRIIQTSWKSDYTVLVDNYFVEIEPGKAAYIDFLLSPKLTQIKFKQTKTRDVGK